MSTATATKENGKTTEAPSREMTPFERLMNRPAKFVPFGETDEIELSPNMVQKFIAAPTKSGQVPSSDDCVRFVMLCKSRMLNPWAGDAYMTGYDTQNGPKFECITAMQALLKRAEANAMFDGLESGVIVRTKDSSDLTYRPGDFLMDGEILLGGWARVYRKDRTHPFYDAINVTTFDKGVSRWKADRAGMIVKCAESSVLRMAFPTQIGSLYIKEEMEAVHATVQEHATHDVAGTKVSTLNDLAERMLPKPSEPKEEMNPEVQEEPEPQPSPAIAELRSKLALAKDEKALKAISSAWMKQTNIDPDTFDEGVTLIEEAQA